LIANRAVEVSVGIRSHFRIPVDAGGSPPDSQLTVKQVRRRDVHERLGEVLAADEEDLVDA